MTNGGLFGTISEVKSDYFLVKISEGVFVKINKKFIYPVEDNIKN